MNRFVQLLAAVLMGFGYLGYVHPISLAPDLKAMRMQSERSLVQRKVAYFISNADRNVILVSAAGGGEKVGYTPYSDLEPGLAIVLSRVFVEAERTDDPTDIAALKRAGVDLVVRPEITTTSSSNSAMTWPPTEFGIVLKLHISDVNGNLLETLQVDGKGRADLLEFNGNYALAAKRAAIDMLLELYEELIYSKAAQPELPVTSAL